MYSLQLSAQHYQSMEYNLIQELLPSKLEQQVQTMTAYHEDTRVMTVIGTDFPSVGKCTVWQSQINSAVNGTTPLYSNIEISYPISRSPAPMNVAKLVVSRVITDKDGAVFVVFTNGEVHSLDFQKAGQKSTILFCTFSNYHQYHKACTRSRI